MNGNGLPESVRWDFSMAIPPSETAAVRARYDVRVPGSRQRRATLVVLALGEILFLTAFFVITLATEADAADAFGHAHSQIMLMMSLIALPGGIVRLLAVLFARASLHSSLLARAVCARGVWIVLVGMVLSAIGPVVCLLNAGEFVPASFSALDGEALIVSVMWSCASVIGWSLAVGAVEVGVIRAACAAAVQALRGGRTGPVDRSLTDF